MSKIRGGIIGTNIVPSGTEIGGIWTMREAESLRRLNTWPMPFAPDAISGLQLWLDAADASTLYDATSGGSLVAADGGVARWEDKSGNGRHATQGTSANRPARKTVELNGLDGLDLDGTNDSMAVNSIASFFSGTNKVFTIFGVAKTDATGSTQDFLSIGNSANNNQNIRATWNNGSQKLSLNREPPTGGVTKSVTGGTSLGTAAKVATWRFDGSNGRLFLNGVSDATTTDLAQASNININVASVGVLPRLSPAVYFNGLIFEILIYNSALSDADREAVENYLLAKWGIA